MFPSVLEKNKMSDLLIISKGSEEKRNHPKIIPCVPRGLGLEMFCKIDKGWIRLSQFHIMDMGWGEHDLISYFCFKTGPWTNCWL